MVEVIPRLEHMSQFLKDWKLNPKKSRKELFIENFILSEEELETMLFFGMFSLDNDVDSLEMQLSKMRLLAYENFIQEELELLQEQFPSYSPIKYELFILDENDDFVIEKLGGVSVFTDWNGNMWFAVLPEDNVRLTLKSVITHEYHHHWRISALEMDEESQTLLDRLILEGLAEHFVRIKLGEIYLGPYKDALTEKQAETLWESTYKPHIGKKGQTTDLYMFGNREEGLPIWGGYSLGYYLVKWFLERNEDLSIGDLTLLPSDKFIV
ncbi:DUF2268 domain-containing putative Zn-dependent protease [Paenisporosarcina sp. TG20]|uniref:DUF2268 domain-containing putative Zn-dependent protease n=1 Tax=Paenisporosarcina sp. TG20 TaxID=1211706 RepID=UPI000319BEB0|nr:DUF2268 domain-containing putative Zn-dependent protease [Paenisporosarcina sp. TG20]